jgi:cytochrome P450
VERDRARDRAGREAGDRPRRRSRYPLPGRAGLGLLGIPVEDFDQIKAWSGGRVLFTYGHLPPDDQVQVAKNVIAFWHYVETYVADRDADRGDDFTSDILRYHDERPEEVTIDDIVNIVYAMALAGHDSTTNAMGSMLRHLLAHQDQWHAVVEDRSLIPNAVEEALRFDGPVRPPAHGRGRHRARRRGDSGGLEARVVLRGRPRSPALPRT